MEKEIWKYILEVENNFVIEMPKGADILSAQVQFGIPCIWALVNPTAEKEKRSFLIVGTGHQIHYDMGVNYKYIGTFLLMQEAFVAHLFENIGI